MRFSVKTADPGALRCGCVIVPVLAKARLGEAGTAIDKSLGGAISKALARGDLASKAGSTLLLYGEERKAARVLLVSMGADATISEKSFREATLAGLRHAGTVSSAEVLSVVHEASVENRDLAWQLRVQVLAARQGAYRFESLKSKKEKDPVRPASLALLVAREHAAAARKTVAQATALANGVDLAKDLGNLPGNVCTPAHLANAARSLGREFRLKVQVLERKQMQALKMGALLAVAQGSDEAPKLIVIQYNGGTAKQAPVVLVGKGITFDTGGISIKPAPEMDEMKYDMCGAASVLGTIRAIAEMKLAINVVGVIPSCENMPSGRAIKPGDIVTSMSGQTVEILNTDAEGRLILCDALTYVERFKPAAVIDIATLTGACVIALGHHNSAMFTSSDTLAGQLSAAGREMADPCWRMPLDDEYQEALKSPFADMANVGGRAGGAVTAACFLSRFTKAYEWAHLDIAGTAWRSGTNKGSSGRPVPLLTGFLAARAQR
ncbi:MAG: leucyl aminopeptidase [Burkholderiaceae bacterium]|nr:leucyl aminopeptidase [Burkholderiaceae bacterium]